MQSSRAILALAFATLIISCNKEKEELTLFTKVSPETTGIRFENNLTFDEAFNIYTYRNYYNGGGVGIGDINNDGLMDVYMSANMTSNKLYINKGDFKFEDVTDKSGTAGTKSWSTGVSMADVNGDGWLDIYVCNSGDLKGEGKENELFINNGDLTFTERAREYNVADPGFTTHAAFFDYDKDGDLDLYILNNSYQAIGSFNLRKNERPNRDPLGGDKLMRNDGNVFTDVSVEAGIYGSVIGFGLGVTVGDVDKDGWPDLYISNDFFERDYLYINNKNGTFREALVEQMNTISAASMGADLADINNDSYPDIFVTDMLPADNARLKTVTTFDNWDRYQYNLQNDYYHQFNRNTLQLNNGNGTFSEVGRLAGLEATDWSWGAFMFDADNDGLKDVFVANGIYQDLTNQDYLQYVSSDEVVKSIVSGKGVDYKKLVELIPSNAVPNFIFKNEGNLKFANMSKEWGMGDPDFSNGTAYGDLDNDGDLDLVLNNVNSVATVFRNESNTLKSSNRYLKFELTGTGKNTGAFGTNITLTTDSATLYIEQMPIRGFESTMDPRPNVGLGTAATVKEIVVRWPDDRVTRLSNIATNQTLKLSQADGVPDSVDNAQVVQPIFASKERIVNFKHEENQFVDFDRDRLIFHMISSEGPRMAKGDVNGDGRDDLFIGGARDQAAGLFVQTANGEFISSNQQLFAEDRASEDTGSEFFDADGDGDFDLYVCAGGNEYSTSSIALASRLYINNGKGVFTKREAIFPDGRLVSSAVAKAGDFDNDGDKDLFVGVRLRPFAYGTPQSAFLLLNDGKGNFTNVTDAAAQVLNEIGMVTDATWADVNGDGTLDLVIVGEYMAIKVLVNVGGKLTDTTPAAGTDQLTGWWNRIEATDLDNDGDMDFVVANHGQNSRFRASPEKPLCLYMSDFDQNGTVEHIICSYNGDKSYPMVLRHDLVGQIPALKKKYLKYDAFKDQTITDIFTQEQLSHALKLEVHELRSGVLVNDGKGKFTWKPLPVEAQFAPMFGIEAGDFDGDKITDLVVGGNFYRAKPEAGRYDASFGLMLKGVGDGTFVAVNPSRSGIELRGEVRDMITMKVKGRNQLVISRNNDYVTSITADR